MTQQQDATSSSAAVAQEVNDLALACVEWGCFLDPGSPAGTIA